MRMRRRIRHRIRKNSVKLFSKIGDDAYITSRIARYYLNCFDFYGGIFPTDDLFEQFTKVTFEVVNNDNDI